MAEFNYLREKRRMLDSLGRTSDTCMGVNCMDCPLYSKNNKVAALCSQFEIEYFEEATDIVRKWSQEHPIQTNAEKFEEVFGICPHDEYCPVDCSNNPSGKGRLCDGCEYNDYWQQEYKPPRKEVKDE